jgi:hypothetical protein
MLHIPSQQVSMLHLPLFCFFILAKQTIKKDNIFWNLTSCIPVDVHLRSGETLNISSILKLGAVLSSETSVNIYRNA